MPYICHMLRPMRPSPAAQRNPTTGTLNFIRNLNGFGSAGDQFTHEQVAAEIATEARAAVNRYGDVIAGPDKATVARSARTPPSLPPRSATGRRECRTRAPSPPVPRTRPQRTGGHRERIKRIRGTGRDRRPDRQDPVAHRTARTTNPRTQTGPPQVPLRRANPSPPITKDESLNTTPGALPGTAPRGGGWQGSGYCSACWQAHPGPCGCDCHRLSDAVREAPARDWRDLAACRDVNADLFFPVGDPAAPANVLQAAEAKRVCAGCQVRAECLSFALSAAEPFGVWGGTSEDERNAARLHLTRGVA